VSWVERATEWIKLAPRYLFAIAVVVCLLLFGPKCMVQGLGLSDLVASGRPWLGAALLLSVALLLAHAVAGPGGSVVSYLREKSEKRQCLKRAKGRLHQLTPEEKRVLAAFLVEHTRTQRFDPSSGLIGELCIVGILYRSANIGDVLGWDYNLHPWAWKYLNENPRIVLNDEDMREREANRDMPLGRRGR
jgi:hypothetical protein